MELGQPTKEYVVLGRLGELCRATAHDEDEVIELLKKERDNPESVKMPSNLGGGTVGEFIWREWNRAGRKIKEVKDAR